MPLPVSPPSSAPTVLSPDLPSLPGPAISSLASALTPYDLLRLSASCHTLRTSCMAEIRTLSLLWKPGRNDSPNTLKTLLSGVAQSLSTLRAKDRRIPALIGESLRGGCTFPSLVELSLGGGEMDLLALGMISHAVPALESLAIRDDDAWKPISDVLRPLQFALAGGACPRLQGLSLYGWRGGDHGLIESLGWALHARAGTPCLPLKRLSLTFNSSYGPALGLVSP